MTEIAERVAQIMRDQEAITYPGLTDAELEAAERRHDITFGVDHRALLKLGVPTASPDWRDPDDPKLERLEWPVQGVLFDVEENSYWPSSWGDKPTDMADALEIAAHHIAIWPRMIPLWGPRFTPSGAGPGAPVFSIIQSDCIFYGDDLVHWAELEFLGKPHDTALAWDTLLPWSAFAFGRNDQG